MIEIDDNEHSERGPSTAHRWRVCPGSVALSRGIPNTAGFDAAEGTVFHEYAALCLEFRIDPQVFIGEKMLVPPHGMVEFNASMAGHMLNGLDILWALMDEPGSKWIIEKRVPLHNWIGPGEFGTTDFMLVNPALSKIVVWDWKYGAGVPVDPERNDQAILYFLGAWDAFGRGMFWDYLSDLHGENWGMIESGAPWEDDILVQVMIEQPRAKGGGGTWTTNVSELLRLGEQIKRDAAKTYEPGAPLVPGEKQCKFCPAARANVCEARARYVVELLGVDFEDLDSEAPLSLPKALTPEARTKLLMARPMIDGFMQQLHGEAYDDLMSRRPCPGLKLVEGRHPPRKWRDEAKAEVLLKSRFGEKAYTKKLLSPTAANDLLGDTEYNLRIRPMVEYGEPRPEMVPVTDKRPPIPDRSADFDDEDVLV
jgi:hypothetical protein